MEDRVALLEARVGELAETLSRVEGRLRALEGSGVAAAPPARTGGLEEDEALLPRAPDAARVTNVTGLVGGSFLGLAGAFLVRAVTEAGTIPPAAGVALGLAYAAVWAFLADREGGRGRALVASFHGFLCVAIGFPLVFEATARFEMVPPVVAAAATGTLTALLVALAWRRDLQALAWGATLAGLGTALALLVETRAGETFTALLLALGAGSLWLTYGRRWHALRWPAALAADAAVAVTSFLAARDGGPPEAWKELSPGAVAALALVLVLVYPGSFAARTLSRLRSVNPFEIVQTLLALLVGYGGAVAVARAAGVGATGLGVAALVLAAGGYAVALAFVEKKPEWGANFVFFTSIALVLALSGSRLVFGERGATTAWCVLGLGAAAVGARVGRVSLQAHAAVYLAVAAGASGLLGAAVDAFGASAGTPWAPFGGSAALVASAAAVACGVVATARDRDGLRVAPRLPAFVLLLLAAAGAGGLLVTVLVRSVGASGPAAAGAAAAIRTGVLALAAVALAALGARTPLREARWLVIPLLALGAGKLLLEDLPAGRPATLFPAFALYGAALLAAPRLLRSARRQGSPRAAAAEEGRDAAPPAASA